MSGRSDGGIVRVWARSPSFVIVRPKPAGVYELSSVAVSESSRKEWTVPRGIRTMGSYPMPLIFSGSMAMTTRT
jgi:hypothetical protein